MTFRLLTYNIRQGGSGRAAALSRVIDACAPDLVLLQEATDPSTVETIAGLTRMTEWRSVTGQSLGYLSRVPIAMAERIKPRLSRHAFLHIVTGGGIRLFGVHLSAVHAAWTERRRLMELRSLLASVGRHEPAFHVLAGDFNTLAPGEPLDVSRLPARLRPLVWLSGGRIRWRTIQTVLDAGYADAYRSRHPGDAGATMPAFDPHVRLDYVFVPHQDAARVVTCDVVRLPEAAAASDHLPVFAELRVD